MRTEKYNLVVLHHEEVFETRELALEYLNGYYKPFSLEAEPVVVKYGEANNPNIILAFGTSNNAPGNYYAIDMQKAVDQINELTEEVDGNKEELEYIAEVLDGVVKATGLTLDENKIEDKITYKPDSRDEVIGEAITIAEALDLLSKYTQQEIKDNKLSVEDTNSVQLDYSDNPNGGKILKANVKVSTDGDTDDLAFNNNIIGIKPDGIYAASNLAYDDVRHQLIFTTSGYKNGRFQDDAIVQRVDLGEHIDVVGGQTDTLETLVNKSGNVATVTGNVKLGSTNSIVVRNGGLEANITVDVDSSTNKLIVTIGNQTITKQLPGVELFESAEYNDANEELIITFRTGNTLVIPIHGIIHTWDTVNSDNSPITLTKTVVTGGVDKLSANIKLRSTDNLIGLENGRLYVSEQGINDKVSNETARATAAEDALRASVQTLQSDLNTETARATAAEGELTNSLTSLESGLQNEVTRAQTAEETLNNRIAHDISDVNAAIAAETARATAAESGLQTEIDELEEAVGVGSEQTLADAKAYTDAQVLAEKTEREAKDVELNNKIETVVRDAADDATAKANAAEANANAYTDAQVLAEKNRAEAAEQTNASAISNLATEVDKKIETVEIVKNSQSDLQYTLKVDGQDVGEINIPKDQFLRSAEYDAGNKSLIFVFETTNGTETTTVNVSDLVDTYSAGNGLMLDGTEFSVRLNEDSESYLSVSEEGIKLMGIDAKFAETSEYVDAQVLAEKNRAEAAEQTKANAADVYTKTEIDNKGYLTEHQDISNLATIASVDAVTEVAADNASAIQELSAEVDDMKFITNETDTVRMTMVKETGAETRVVSSDVKLKTLSGENANIIKSDANGLYATVTFNYDKATNKITFNDGNGNKVFELNNFGILQEAFYDSENKSIVLVVKKDDESTERITIPVADLVNEWSVQNNTNSPILLNKTAGEDGDVLSAEISILNNENNLLVNDNGSLFVDGDCNSHKALWGNEVTNVQGVINILWGAYNDNEEIKQDIADLKEDNENIKDTLADLQEDLDNQIDQIVTNTSDIADLKERVENLENGFGDLTTTVNNFDNRITEAENKAQQALDAVEALGDISTINSRLDRIEQVLEQLIDFGEYNIQL